jgi:hypothetical protein
LWTVATQLGELVEEPDRAEPIPALLVNSQTHSQSGNGQLETIHDPTLTELLSSLNDLCTIDEDADTIFYELLNCPPAPPSPPLTPPPIPPFQPSLEHYLRDTRPRQHRLYCITVNIKTILPTGSTPIGLTSVAWCDRITYIETFRTLQTLVVSFEFNNNYLISILHIIQYSIYQRFCMLTLIGIKQPLTLANTYQWMHLT